MGVSDGSYRGAGDDAASYFTFGVMNYYRYNSNTNSKITLPQIGGQGSVFYDNQEHYPGYFPSGSGGAAGKGGVVNVGPDVFVYAYNGDRITNGDYTNIYDYDKDGNNLGTTCYVLTKYKAKDKNGNPIQTSPLKIYAQGGILRKVYYNNLAWGRKPTENGMTTGWDYFYSIFGTQLEESVADIKYPTQYSEVENHLIRDEIIHTIDNEHPENNIIIKTNYINPETGDCYGVGSGAGYMEVSNGTYTVHTSDTW